MMTSVFFAALLLATSANAADWFKADKEVSMPSLVADGYQVVGFSVLPEKSRVMDVTAYRFVLQKETSVYLCTDKTTGSSSVLLNCFRLVEPKS